jgi:hypothetical protein
MDLLQFKTLSSLKLKGDVKEPSNDTVYDILILESIENIANYIIPLDLVTEDTTVPTLRWINGTQLVRQPLSPLNNSNKLDIDEQLHNAVLYDFLAMYSNKNENIAKYLRARDGVINNYRWNNYKLLESLIQTSEEME